MDYISTRGGGRPVSAAQAIVSGLAPDGGLYVPQSLPSFSLDEIASLAKLGYTGRAVEVLSSPDEYRRITREQDTARK